MLLVDGARSHEKNLDQGRPGQMERKFLMLQQSAGRWGQGRSQHLHQLEIPPEDRVALVYVVSGDI